MPSARVNCVASLAGHELKFHKHGKDGSAKCDVVDTDIESCKVIGVVFEISELEKSVLDGIEGLGRGYEEKSVSLTSDLGEILVATTYYATDIKPDLKPFHWYKQHVLFGAKENALPEQYISKLSNVQSINDPDRSRHDHEISIYSQRAVINKTISL